MSRDIKNLQGKTSDQLKTLWRNAKRSDDRVVAMLALKRLKIREREERKTARTPPAVAHEIGVSTYDDYDAYNYPCPCEYCSQVRY